MSAPPERAPIYLARARRRRVRNDPSAFEPVAPGVYAVSTDSVLVQLFGSVFRIASDEALAVFWPKCRNCGNPASDCERLTAALTWFGPMSKAMGR